MASVDCRKTLQADGLFTVITIETQLLVTVFLARFVRVGHLRFSSLHSDKSEDVLVLRERPHTVVHLVADSTLWTLDGVLFDRVGHTALTQGVMTGQDARDVFAVLLVKFEADRAVRHLAHRTQPFPHFTL